MHRYTLPPIKAFLQPDARFDKVHFNQVGPFPPSQGHRYLLACIDRFTRWPEATPLPDITASTVAAAFISTWVSRFGCHSQIVKGRGRQFESSLFKELTNTLGTTRLRTTAYHPQSNGLVESFHRHLKSALMAYGNPNEWVLQVPLVLLGIRTALKEDLRCSTAELGYRTQLRLPSNFFEADISCYRSEGYSETLRELFGNVRPIPTRIGRSKSFYVTADLKTPTHVFVRQDHQKEAIASSLPRTVSCN